MNVCKLTGDYVFYKEPIGYGSFSIIYKGYNIFGPYKEIIKEVNLYRIPTLPRISDKKFSIFMHYIVYFVSMTIFSLYYFFCFN